MVATLCSCFSWYLYDIISHCLVIYIFLQVVLVGFTMGIPDSIMGITFLAAGTSVPDAMASVMVAKQGESYTSSCSVHLAAVYLYNGDHIPGCGDQCT